MQHNVSCFELIAIFIFDEKTSIRLGRSSDIDADLSTIQTYFEELDFNKFQKLLSIRK